MLRVVYECMIIGTDGKLHARTFAANMKQANKQRREWLRRYDIEPDEICIARMPKCQMKDVKYWNTEEAIRCIN